MALMQTIEQGWRKEDGYLYNELVAIRAAVGGAAPAPATPATPFIDRVANAGNTSAGALSFAIANVGAADGTVGGKVLKPTEVVEYPVLAQGYNSIAYDATGTEFLIIESR